MVDSYWRKLDNVTNNLENAIQISGILLKLKEYENKIKHIETNKNKINSNLIRIEQNENNIVDMIPSLKVFDKKFDIENKSFYFDKNSNIFSILEIEIKNDFSKNGMLHVKSNIDYEYEDLYRSSHYYQFAGDNNLFYDIMLFNSRETDNISHVKDDFYVKIKENYKTIVMLVSLARAYPQGSVEYKLKHINKNSINIEYYDINDMSLKINENEKNININKNNIDNLKNNKTYLKNLYNILFYNSKTQVTFTVLFYQNFFNINANKNDFIEVSFKMLLQTANASLSKYVIVNQEILDDDISLFKKSTTLNRFKHSSDKITINANFVYHFKKDVKKLKFILYFTRTYNQYLDLHYIVNKDYKLILKHYSP